MSDEVTRRQRDQARVLAVRLEQEVAWLRERVAEAEARAGEQNAIAIEYGRRLGVIVDDGPDAPAAGRVAAEREALERVAQAAERCRQARWYVGGDELVDALDALAALRGGQP